MYMLDTNICIYIIKNKPASVRAKFEQMQIGDVAMSMITFGELEYGALRSQNAIRQLQIIDDLSRYIPVLAMQQEVAKTYAEIRADLTSKGTPIGNNDLWIAAHARTIGATLVSNNTKEFVRVDGLKLENWV
ncbi:type II toxin-antitoxin system VapC family toxin [Thiomicrospira sp. ALE5]|uniref:type II toxin-antitoxin system tRNA(fMet)-specific endonuclease VapC n=1 Tax=Thiomicrospira sp. ALE5 TaxID=748650 RepID=UPI0008EB0DAE|nr:tRNA(fMet)-specific endonuclease VapC [Thiomicrospira sp. ALE5]